MVYGKANLLPLQYVADKAGDLVMALKNLESISEAIATFWTIEADNFAAQGAKMKTTQVVMVKSMKGNVVKDNITFWTKAKEELDRYAVAMSEVNNSFNFNTEAKPPSAQRFCLPNLDLTLHLPSTVDIKAITAD